MSTFKLEVESDIEEENDFEDDSLQIIHYKDEFFHTQINEIASRDDNKGLFYL